MSPIKLSSTAQAILASAAANTDRLVSLPERLPIAAQRAVVKSMLKSGLVEEVTVDEAQPAWRTADNGERLGLRATRAGLAGVGATAGDESAASKATAGGSVAADMPNSSNALPDGAAAHTALLSPRARLCAAAEAVMAAWDDTAAERPGLPGAIGALRIALATATQMRTGTGAFRPPRTDTKQATVLTLLRRPEGATVAQVAEATGWASHTVRGFFAGLKNKGITVTVLERVRQVGSGKQGAKGSYTIYRVEEVG